MSDQSEYKPPQQGEYKPPQQGEGYNKQKQPYEPPPPPPPPPPCPDPCADERKWGPPGIVDPDCCPPHTCCPGEKHCCTWEEVDDPCVRAASCVGKGEWAKIECKCESSNPKCCEEWECGCYPQGTCVPCEPCKDLLPNGNGSNGGCDNGEIDCTKDELRTQLDSLTKCIASQQNEKAKIEADIKSRQEREKDLRDLIDKYQGIQDKYKTEHHKLVCREDCLKGFYRDVSAVFNDPNKYKPEVLEKWKKVINDVLCNLELEKCCQKNLDGKLTKVTKLIWEKQQAEKELKKAEKAFEIIKDLPKWLDDRFKELETLKDQIAVALNDNDPEKHKWAFYLFYWQFVPKLCKCFPFPFCCEMKKPGSEEGSQKTDHEPPKTETPPEHLGCQPGDWHPSLITVERLKVLICCAWDYARKRKQDAQEINDELEKVKSNLEFIKKRVDDDEKALDKNIKAALENVGKPVAPTGTSS